MADGYQPSTLPDQSVAPGNAQLSAVVSILGETVRAIPLGTHTHPLLTQCGH